MNHQNAGSGLSEDSLSEGLWGDLLTSLSVEFGHSTEKEAPPIIDWVQGIALGVRKFSFEGHEYQREMLEEKSKKQIFLKGAQLGMTEVCILKTLWGLIYAIYPQGCIYWFPTQNNAEDFAKARFNTVLTDNPGVSSHVLGTDSTTVKRLGRTMLFIRGLRSTGKIEGIKKTSPGALSIAADRMCFDEADQMEPEMIDLALERISHSELQEQIFLSTPSIPEWGIHKLYLESDQRIWMIRCGKCNTETCLEIEFPNCLEELSDGRTLRVCRKCRRPIFPKDGQWRAQAPDCAKDSVGFWISQLNSTFVDPGTILRAFNDPPAGRLQEVYNSKLAMPYVPAEDRLTTSDVYQCCGQDPMAPRDRGPCAMGIDVGAQLHITVAYKPKDKVLAVPYLARVSSFNDAHDIATRFNVKSAVIDALPETRKARKFQQVEPYKVYLCYYDSNQFGHRWDEGNFIIHSNRTELLDTTHELVQKPGTLILPRRNAELEEFALEMSNAVKILQEDKDGGRSYKYRATGADHYRHSLGYCWLASQKIGISPDNPYQDVQKYKTAIMDYDPFADQDGFNP
jgi:hypothetical protein